MGGGALYAQGSAILSENKGLTFKNNSTTSLGGAVYAYSGTIEFLKNTDLSFINNKATNRHGGALAAYYGKLNIKDNDSVSIKNNTANQYGAAVYAGDYSNVVISGNKKLEISGNTAGDAAIYACGKTFTLSNNGTVIFSGNSDSSGHVISNAAAGSVMEIAHNTSVTFSGNEGTADVSNNGTLYVSADAGQGITFEHGIQNGGTGVAYLGKDSAGAVSTGGTYTFTNGTNTATMQNLGTTVATIGNNGGMVLAEGMLTVGNTEFASTDLRFTMESTSLKFSDVTFSGEAALTVDLGYFGDRNFLWMDNVAGDNVSLSLLIDLVNAKTIKQTLKLEPAAQDMGTEIAVLSAKQEATLYLEDYFEVTDPRIAIFSVEVILKGVLEDGTPLIIDAGSTGISQGRIIAEGYEYDHTEDGLLYYRAGELVPEPATATLSLLALAGLCARRRRKAA